MRRRSGDMELAKMAPNRPAYEEGLRQIEALGFGVRELIEHFPAFTGHLTLARVLSLYEAYRMTLGVAGHIAEIGVYLGAGTLLFAKLTTLFEPASTTLVHGFDWFRGMDPEVGNRHVRRGECRVDRERVLALVRAQRLDPVVRLHDLDVRRGLAPFLRRHEHLQFKLVFVDAGTYDVVRASITHLWPRVTPGGVMLFDHYNHEIAPGETRAIRECLPGVPLRTLPFGWMPTAYAVKPADAVAHPPRRRPGVRPAGRRRAGA